MTGRYFILSAEDPDTGASCLEARFWVDQVDELRAILSEMADGDPDLDRIFWLDDEELGQIAETFGVAFDPGDREVSLTDQHALSTVPYLIHTNYELALMLEDRKPFAFFGDAYPSEWFDEYLSRFEPYVEAGRFVRRIIDTPFSADGAPNPRGFVGYRNVFFALPAEAWRIDAFLLLGKVARSSGWNATLERLEGELLGYSDWENDWWAENHGEWWKRPDA